MVLRRTVMVLAMSLAVVALAACGGDSDDETTAAEGGGSTAEFVETADAACIDAAKKTTVFTDANNLPPVATNAQLRAYFPKRTELREAKVEALSAIEPPQEVAADYEEYIAGLQANLDIYQGELLAVIEAGGVASDPEYNSLVTKATEISDKAEEAAASAGLKACSEVLPANVETEVENAVITYETTLFDDCTDFVTEIGIEELFGSLKVCQNAQKSSEGLPTDVNFANVDGVEDVTATVIGTPVGGVNNGVELAYGLRYQDGTWKMNSITQAP